MTPKTAEQINAPQLGQAVPNTNLIINCAELRQRAEKAELERDELKAILARLKADPGCVRVNMLRGELSMLPEIDEYPELQAKLEAMTALKTSLQEKCAEMCDLVEKLWNKSQNHVALQYLVPSNELLALVNRSMATDCGKGWHSPEDWDALQAKCAEMRDWISDSIGLHEGYCIECNEQNHTENCSVPRLLSADCGSNYVSKEQVKPLKDALEYVQRWWDETGRDEGWHQSIGRHVERALERAKELGV